MEKDEAIRATCNPYQSMSTKITQMSWIKIFFYGNLILMERMMAR